MEIKFNPVGIIRNSRIKPKDDFWGEIVSEIEFSEYIPTESFENISDFSHLEIIYYFSQVEIKDIVYKGKPRGNSAYPNVGIFGQKKKTGQISLDFVQLNSLNIQTEF